MKVPLLLLITIQMLENTWALCTIYTVTNRRTYYYNRINKLYSYVICSNFSLESGKQLHGDHKYITFENCNIPVIPVGVFTSLSVTELYLNSSQVSTIEPGAFNGMTKLENLNLRDNNIQGIARGTINSLANLKVLDLSSNHLLNIEDDSLHGLLKLETLKLFNNSIESISSRTFSSLSNLKYLDLGHNNLNKIENDTFSPTAALRVLNISFNHFEELDCNGFPNTLQVLNISSNKLNNVKNLSNLQVLQTLDCRKNNLSKIDSINANIVNLYLGYNNLQILTSSMFSQSLNLKDLDLSHNKISKIDVNLFQNLTKLMYLYLNNNEIPHLSLGSFRNLTTLKILNLSHNFLVDLEFGTFTGLSQLDELHLDNNLLIVLHENSFHVLSKLKILKLHNNSLLSIDAVDLLLQLPNLKDISVSYNNWSCNSLLSILNTFRQKKVMFREGSSFSVPNIYGIPCMNEKALKTDKIRANIEISTEIATKIPFVPPNLYDNFENTSFYKYFYRDFYNSGFFKYFNQDFKLSEFYKYQQKNSSPVTVNISCDDFKIGKSLPVEGLSTKDIFSIIFMLISTVLLVIIVGFLMIFYCSMRKRKFLRSEENRSIMFGAELELI